MVRVYGFSSRIVEPLLVLGLVGTLLVPDDELRPCTATSLNIKYESRGECALNEAIVCEVPQLVAVVLPVLHGPQNDLSTRACLPILDVQHVSVQTALDEEVGHDAIRR